MRIKLKVLLFLSFLSFQSIAQRLVLPGDYPDPSVVKIGDTYWATATTSNWLPAFPLLKSSDLINWHSVGNIFTEKPDWADYYFWAPEISYENGKVYVYYTAHKKDGNLCVGVASADKPEGPYKDHGPLICQKDGSIDGFPMRDESGKLYLIWKEDGNSVGRPTPIWIQEMNEERTALLGEKKELFRNDAPWEGNLVEGVSMMRHGKYIYAFYAAGACCGRECKYKTGIARAERLLGPWEKYEKNPIAVDNETWMCSGHGTPVEKAGKFYYMYHAYNSRSNVYIGRQGMLVEFRFTPDGWIEFVKEKSPSGNYLETVRDQFNAGSLSENWQWSVFQPAGKEIRNGRLVLNALPSNSGAFLGQKTYQMHYDVNVTLFTRRSHAASGIGLIGDDENTISALVKNDSIKIVRVRGNKETVLMKKFYPVKNRAHLKMQVRNGKDISFLISRNGKKYAILNEIPVDGDFLPPWDRALRVGLVAKGGRGQKSVFDNFYLKNISGASKND